MSSHEGLSNFLAQPIFSESQRKDRGNHQAADGTVDKLYRQIERYRGKRKKKYRGTQENLNLGEPLPLEEDEELEEVSSIVRTKRFVLHPMSDEEALDQMELLGHDFFVFFNAEEEAINVLYRRHDGNYGLLQPEFG